MPPRDRYAPPPPRRSIQLNSNVPEGARCIERQPGEIDILVRTLLSEERRAGVPVELRESTKLRKHLSRVLVTPNDMIETKFIQPLIQGLINGGRYINYQFQYAQGEAWSLLSIACQWKNFFIQFGWKGRNEVVSMILATPGINVNARMPNQTTAAHLAVKYGDAETLKILIEAGIDLALTDKNGHSVLHNAIEYPRPEIMSQILEHIPATESFNMYDSSVRATAADWLLHTYNVTGVRNIGTTVSKGAPLSWRILGSPPCVHDVAECMIMLRQRGARFSAEGSRTDWMQLGFVGRGERGVSNADADFMALGNSLFGWWLPERYQREVLATPESLPDQLNASQNECIFCLEEFDEKCTLYCGHSFCRQCIIAFGRTPGFGNKRADACPLCRRLISLDVSPDRDVRMLSRSQGEFSNQGNIDERHRVREASQLLGVQSLSDEQVNAEVKFHPEIIPSRLSSQQRKQKLVESIEKGHERAQIELELTLTHPITTDDLVLMSPAHGPVAVEIFLKGIPVMANISNNSRYTTVPSSIVRNFGFEKIEQLSTKEFCDALSGKPVDNQRITCLDNFTFSIGGIDVSLRNAVEIDPGQGDYGIVLGQDFFLSGAYCVVDTFLGGTDNDKVLMRADGSFSWITNAKPKASPSESLRYFSHDGKIAHLPILHFNPNNNITLHNLTVKEDTTFTECAYCCRRFPKGMQECETCAKLGESVFYCDDNCKASARSIHVHTREAHEGDR